MPSSTSGVGGAADSSLEDVHELALTRRALALRPPPAELFAHPVQLPLKLVHAFRRLSLLLE
jgi:hypothetical protein